VPVRRLDRYPKQILLSDRLKPGTIVTITIETNLKIHPKINRKTYQLSYQTMLIAGLKIHAVVYFILDTACPRIVNSLGRRLCVWAYSMSPKRLLFKELLTLKAKIIAQREK
jgi:hypothetical protein